MRLSNSIGNIAILSLYHKGSVGYTIHMVAVNSVLHTRGYGPGFKTRSTRIRKNLSTAKLKNLSISVKPQGAGRVEVKFPAF